jgi:Predicted periplasmic protein (DUF2092)
VKPKFYWSMFLLISSLFVLSACGGATTIKSLTAQDIINKASSADMKSAEFTVNLTTTIQGQITPLTGAGKYIKSPYRMSMDLSMTYQGTAVNLSMVEDDTYTYGKDSMTNQWTKSPRTDSTSLTDYSMNTPTLVGKETINGVETYHVKGTDKDGNPEEYWFKTDNFFLVKGTLNQKNSDSSLTGTTTITNWNSNVTIDIPNV